MNETPNLLPEMSEKFDIVLKNVMAAKKEMGSTVKKDAANPFHKSRYASLGAHLELCEGVLDKHGLILMQTVNGSHDKAIMIATLCHVESGQWIKSYLPLPNPKNDSQGLGASITYMRRYSINSMLGLTAEDDDGETAAGRGKHDDYKKEQKAASQTVAPAPANNGPSKFVEALKTNQAEMAKIANFPVPKINESQVRVLKKMEEDLDKDCKAKLYKWMLSTYKASTLEELPADSFQKVLGGYQNAVKFMQNSQLEVAHA